MQNPTIHMVDVKGQYQKIKTDVDQAVLDVIESGAFINGPAVKSFKSNLSTYLGGAHVIPCGNGTDALQIAMMGLGLQPGDEVIVPSFTYVATAEVIALLQLTPVMVDVDPNSFNLTAEMAEQAITDRTRAIVPVHLFGQCADMEGLLALANKHDLYIIEDAAQAIGAHYTFSDGERMAAGTMGHAGGTSFYPSKNLGCYGDGGAIFCQDESLAATIQKVANHGQVKRYYHDCVGVNSRLDSIQAAILDIKLTHLDQYNNARRSAADYYDQAFVDLDALEIPFRSPKSTHVFHQYTLKVKNGQRNELKEYLQTQGIPSMIYYPVPLQEQEAFSRYPVLHDLSNADQLCKEVISLPMHSEFEESSLAYISDKVLSFFNK